MNRRGLAPVLGAAAVAALAAAGCASSSSSGSGRPASSGGTVDVYSSLPMQGASSAQTIPMVNGIKLALAQAQQQGRPVHRQVHRARRLDRRRGQVGPGPDRRQRAPGRHRPEGRLLHRRVQLRRVRGVDPDPQPGGPRPGVPGEHLRRPHHGPAGQRAASRRSTTRREPQLPADRPHRLHPGGIRPDGDEAGGLHQGRGRQRQGGVRRGPGDAARAREGHVRGHDRLQHGDRPDRGQLPQLRLDDQFEGANCFFFAGIVSNGAVQITKDVNAALPTRRSSAATACAPVPSRRRPRAACPARSTS